MQIIHQLKFNVLGIKKVGLNIGLEHQILFFGGNQSFNSHLVGLSHQIICPMFFSGTTYTIIIIIIIIIIIW
jgi:hypothetical protein